MYFPHYRDYSVFNENAFLEELHHVNWLEVYDVDIDITTSRVLSIISHIVNKYAPLKKASMKKAKQLSKPWITSGILKSIKRKNSMYKTHFKSNDDQKIQYYKKYSKYIK